MNIDRRLFQYLKQERVTFTSALILAVLHGLAMILQAWYLSKIINGAFLLKQSLEQLLPLLLTLVLTTITRFVLQWSSESLNARFTANIKYRLRRDLIRHLNRLSPLQVQNEKRGELANTVHKGIEALDAYFRLYIPQLFKAALIPLSILFVVFPLDFLSAVVFFFTAPLIPIFMVLIGQLAKSATQRQWKTLSRLSAILLDLIEGLTTLKILNRSQSQVERIRHLSNAFRQTTMKVLRIAFLSALVLEMVATISTAIIAVEIGLRLLYARMPFLDALFILILAPEFYQPMRALGANFHAGMEGAEAAGRIFEILNIPAPDHSHLVKASMANKRPPLIEFKEVTFSYNQDSPPALDRISLRILPGKKTVLIGPSGAGKSTIFNLLLKFAEARKGKILIDGKSLSQIPPGQWYQYISWVPQRPYLFHDTIEQNLRLVRPDAGWSQIVAACKKARLHTFIQSLPGGYQTIVGERGTRLSGGQAQRLALARAFLKDAPILLLDEPTSNLDPQLDREILEILSQLSENKTQFVIAHRFSTLRQADWILVLNNGCLIAEGTFETLQKSNSLPPGILRISGGESQ